MNNFIIFGTYFIFDYPSSAVLEMKFDFEIALLLRIDCSIAGDLRAVSRETANHPPISILISFTSNTKQEISISHISPRSAWAHALEQISTALLTHARKRQIKHNSLTKDCIAPALPQSYPSQNRAERHAHGGSSHMLHGGIQKRDAQHTQGHAEIFRYVIQVLEREGYQKTAYG